MAQQLIDRSFREKIVLVGVALEGLPAEGVDASLDELELLVDTAGADTVARVVQRRLSPDPATYIGKGKAEELRDLSETVDSDTVVFDDELSPAQQFKLEKILGRTAIDRTAVILDIFAQNARSQEGKAQVELAQLRYRLPRLRGRGVTMSRQAGAKGAGGAKAPIGSRGPGETQLEVDRRRILRRISRLEHELADIAKHRATQAKQRRRSRLNTVAVVGYTNAGKSTLLNQLTQAGVLVEDRLFATLDATTRRLSLPGGETVLLTDTVGFVRKLPHALVESFKSTLDVVATADLLIHMVDATSADPDAQIEAVHEVLGEIGARQVPELLVFNKADVAPETAAALAASHPGALAISAHDGSGLEALLLRVGDRLRTLTKVVELVVPYDRGDVLAAVHREGEVLVESFEDDAVRVRARVEPAAESRLREFVVTAT